LLVRFLSKISPSTFSIAVYLSRIYMKTNNKFAAEELIRLYAAFEKIKIDVAKELFKIGSYYKVVGLFNELNLLELEKRYGLFVIEMFGDAYFALRKFREAVTCYEYVISKVAGAKQSRIKAAECHYQLGSIHKSKFRLEQYKKRFGVNSRVEALEIMLGMHGSLKKNYQLNNHLSLKYGIEIHYKVKCC
ncbi:hypothetical protein, partial [Aeromonas veronii]|uniref:hypothetical protein n=4 Tax=Aeromonas veronii TaxID=654 RepID=UPI000A754F2D